MSRKDTTHSEQVLQEMKHRSITKQDIKTIVRLIARSMNEGAGAWANTTICRHFDLREACIDDGRDYLVFEKSKEIIGISGLHHYEWGPLENVWLGWFALNPDFHGRGYGRKMMHETENLAKVKGYKKFFIETSDSPTFAHAVGFYKHVGFSIVGSIENYFPDTSRMLVLLKQL